MPSVTLMVMNIFCYSTKDDLAFSVQDQKVVVKGKETIGKLTVGLNIC